ncbi:MAG: 3-deoxy-D-manno-octulosonic acid transferase [Chlorobi bacterium]|nr:3-deoxy-D-manno-octulosonic acid transferase [Chlorobiota bacterium]
MKYFYNLSIFIYSLLIKVASSFNKKAKLRHYGVKQTFNILKNFEAEKTIWFHCASLGEFEQGRPLIEKIKSEKPEYKIAISFFSPSGYEIRKNYELADIVFYLPSDTKENAKKIISLLKPEIVFFIKYEFWFWILKELKKQNIPTYLISGIFRKNQIFFKPYGNFYRKILLNFKHLFVQNEESKKLLERIDIKNVTTTGDTRFDRVLEISKKRKSFPVIETFTKNKLVFIAGSSWKKDEEIIFNFINNYKYENLKFIIAPHEIKKENIKRIKSLTTQKTVLFSEANNENISSAKILIIDNIGMLSSLYFYTDIAYIGGGFGAGIHNTLEAAVFGVPLIFGPKFQKFEEAKDLIKNKAAFSIKNQNEFNSKLNKLISNKTFRVNSGIQAKNYIEKNIGATNKIFLKLFQ